MGEKASPLADLLAHLWKKNARDVRVNARDTGTTVCAMVATGWPGYWWHDTEMVAPIGGGRAEPPRVTGTAVRSGAAVSSWDRERNSGGDGERNGGGNGDGDGE